MNVAVTGFGGNVKMVDSTYKRGHVWLFVRASEHGAVKSGIHLDKAQAQGLVSVLEEFINRPEETNE